jgi:ankyrin repeat protein
MEKKCCACTLPLTNKDLNKIGILPKLIPLVKNNEINQVLYLLENCKIYHRDTYSEALVFASRNGNVEIMKKLIELGADIDFGNGKPLVDAARYNRLDAVKLLLECGVNESINDYLAFRWSIVFDCWDVITFLIIYSDNNIYRQRMKYVVWADFRGNVGLLKKLKRLWNLHGHDELLLKYSVEQGHIDVVKFLLESGANVHAENGYCLNVAKRDKKVEIIKLLLDYNADVPPPVRIP